MTNASYLDDLCGSIAGLKRLENGYWAHLKQDETISYPDEGLNILADIEARSFWFNHRNAVISAVVRQYPPSGPIIDIGGGNGFVSQGLIQSGSKLLSFSPRPPAPLWRNIVDCRLFARRSRTCWFPMDRWLPGVCSTCWNISRTTKARFGGSAVRSSRAGWPILRSPHIISSGPIKTSIRATIAVTRLHSISHNAWCRAGTCARYLFLLGPCPGNIPAENDPQSHGLESR